MLLDRPRSSSGGGPRVHYAVYEGGVEGTKVSGNFRSERDADTKRLGICQDRALDPCTLTVETVPT